MKANINYLGCYTIANEMYQNEELKFDNAVQRGYVWDNDRQSLLIHSLLTGFPIPPIYTNQTTNSNGDICYDVLDGKQRLQTIIKFMNDEFSLSELEPIEIFNKATKETTLEDISGKKFSELSKIIQKKLELAQVMNITVTADEEEVSEMFFRLNNGKPLSAIEHNRAKAKDIKVIQELGHHELFAKALTEKAFQKYAHEETIIKSYVVLYEDNKDLSAKNIKDRLPEIDITQSQKEELNWCFDFLLNVYTSIINDDTDKKLNKRIAKRIITRTHMLALLPLCIKCKKENISINKMIEFCQFYFAGTKKATNDTEYNSGASAGSSSATNVTKRINRILCNFNDF